MTPPGAIVAVLVLAVASVAAAGGASLRSGGFDPPRPAPDFALPAPDGGEFRLSRLRGQVVAVTFGYTHCVDVCPTVLAELARMRAQLGAAARRVHIVYVTVDPERDTSARLRAYTEQFDPAILGLTGSAAQVAAVWKIFGVSVARHEVAGSTPPAYVVHHSASVFLIDAAGRLRVMAPFGTPLDDIVHDVRALLQE